MKNHIAHLVRKLGVQAFYGIDTIDTAIDNIIYDTASKLLKRLEGCSLFLFEGFCQSSTYVPAALLFRALEFFCYCAPCRYVFKLIEASFQASFRLHGRDREHQNSIQLIVILDITEFKRQKKL